MRTATALVGATSLLISMSCGGAPGTPEGEREAGAATAPTLPRFLSLGTAPPGGAFYVVGGALATTLEQDPVGAGWQVTAEGTKGSQENIRRLAAGELDFALSNAAITFFAVRGAAGWDRAYDVRSVMTLAPNVALFITERGSGVETIRDLEGRRVVLGPAGAGFEYFLRPIVEAHGIRLESIDGLHATQAGAVDLLSDGSAAAAFLGGAVPTASIVQAAAGRDVYYVPYDQEARQALIEEYPFFRPATLPAGTYRGLDQDFAGLDVGSMHLICAAGADDELVYLVTRALYEGRDRVIERHPAGHAIRAENVVRDTGTPFHPGAIRFYREIGIWPDDAAPDAAP